MQLTQQSLSLAAWPVLPRSPGCGPNALRCAGSGCCCSRCCWWACCWSSRGARGACQGLRLTVAPLSLGEQGTAELAADNPTATTLRMEYVPSMPPAARGGLSARQLAMQAHGVAVDHYSLRPLRLGRHAMPALRTRILGRFALAWWPRLIEAPATVTVRPGFLSSDERRRATTRGAGQPLLMAGSGTELLQLRPYRMGDPPRAIDWRATARSGELISREFGLDQHLEILLAVDAGTPEPARNRRQRPARPLRARRGALLPSVPRSPRIASAWWCSPTA